MLAFPLFRCSFPFNYKNTPLDNLIQKGKTVQLFQNGSSFFKATGAVAPPFFVFPDRLTLPFVQMIDNQRPYVL